MASTSAVGLDWFSDFAPARPEASEPCAEDPRLGEIAEFWNGDPGSLTPGRAVLLGFPQPTGTGVAEAPQAIRRWLYRLTPWDAEANVDLAAAPPLDVGDLRPGRSLAESQELLGRAVGAVLASGAVPVILGGGRETIPGHYLGYVAAGRSVGVVAVAADLAVQPLRDGQSHGGSAFREVLEQARRPLPGPRFVCLGAQPSRVSRDHWFELRQRGGVVRWHPEVRHKLDAAFTAERDRLERERCAVWLSIDAASVREADVPGVGAPNPAGFAGEELLACARLAGRSAAVTSLDVVEVNPRCDRAGQSARWAALLVWNFLVGLAARK
jgi:formiminoglutamase